MLNRYGWQLYHWHIEPSSKCSLRCPRCPRQEHPDISWMQKEILLIEIITPKDMNKISTDKNIIIELIYIK